MIAAGILNGEVPMEQVLFDILTDLQERPNVFTESIVSLTLTIRAL